MPTLRSCTLQRQSCPAGAHAAAARTVQPVEPRLARVSVAHDEVKGRPHCEEHGLEVPEDEHDDKAGADPGCEGFGGGSIEAIFTVLH